MDDAELRELGRLPSHKVQAALEAGDFERALALTEQLPKEYVLMHKGLRIVVEILLAYNEEVFRREQVKITEQIRQAIEARDAKLALELLERKHRQHLQIHDAQLAFKATSYAWALEQFGDRALEDCHRHVAGAHRKAFDQWEALPKEEFVRVTAALFALHSEGRFKVTEDAEKFTFTLDACGSGGIMLRRGLLDGQGGEPPKYPRVMMAQAQTFGREAFSSYCSHCAVWNSILPIEWYGHPQWVHSPPKHNDDVCVFHIYKDPKDIPAEYYRSLGKVKPESAPG